MLGGGGAGDLTKHPRISLGFIRLTVEHDAAETGQVVGAVVTD